MPASPLERQVPSRPLESGGASKLLYDLASPWEFISFKQPVMCSSRVEKLALSVRIQYVQSRKILWKRFISFEYQAQTLSPSPGPLSDQHPNSAERQCVGFPSQCGYG